MRFKRTEKANTHLTIYNYKTLTTKYLSRIQVGITILYSYRDLHMHLENISESFLEEKTTTHYTKTVL